MSNKTDSLVHARREFLRGTGAALGIGWLAANWPLVTAAAENAREARAAGAQFRNLAPADAADLAAIAARIIPSDDSPGATEAGVVWFIDQALGSFMSDGAAELASGLAELNGFVGSRHGAGTRFAQLTAAQQDVILHERDQTPFFQGVHLLTLAGMFSLPSYGGNRDNVGWNLIGFDHRHVWSPPFGWYDAEAMKQEPGHG